MRIIRLWLTEAGMKDYGQLNQLSGLLLLLLFWLANTVAIAQNACLDPRFKGDFSVDKARVCVGTPVNITSVPSSIPTAAYNFQYDGTSQIDQVILSQSTTSTYTKPGSYTIIQVGSGGGAGSGTIACREVTVLPTNPVDFTLNACSGRQVTVDVKLNANTSQYDSYVIRWGDGAVEPKAPAELTASPPVHTYDASGQSSYSIQIYGIYNPPASCEGQRNTVNTGNLTTTAGTPIINQLSTTGDNTISIGYQVGNATTAQLYQKDANGIFVATGQTGNGTSPFVVNTNTKQVQCFQVATQDACNSQGTRSSEVCSIVLDANAVNKQNDLSWTPYQGSVTPAQPFRLYRISRNGSPTGGTITSRTTTTFSDNGKIECGTPYCYTVEATVGPTTITSGPACVTGINSEVPGDFQTITVSVQKNQPNLVMSLPVSGTTVSYTLQITRSDNGGPFQTVGSVENRNTFVDDKANVSGGSYCYQVAYQNNCGLTSAPSKPVCTVYLDSKSTNSIDWTADSPFLTTAVQSYKVEVIDSLNGTRQEIQVGGDTRYEPDPNLQSQYRIIAIANGGVQSYSNFFTFRRETQMLVPDAFSPNGDGTNDTFVIRGLFIERYRINIYDRWGTVVFSSTDRNNSWDGTIDGQQALAGQYMYRIETNDLTNQQTVRTGAVLLVR